ncbi:MAG: TPM domain-containing protein [Bacillota bacterium]
MKARGLFALFVSIVLLVLVPLTVYPAELFPLPRGYANDFAGILNPDEVKAIENMLSELERTTGVEFAVAIVDSSSPYDPKMYAVRLFEQWGIGKKGYDNGLLMLISLQERRVEVEVGYGLEPVLTDGMVGEILDDHVIPHFARGEFAQGIIAGLRQAALIVAEKYDVKLEAIPEQRSTSPIGVLALAGILLVILMLVLPRALGRLARKCPRCKARMVAIDRVIVSATASTPGLAVRIYKCLKCGYTIEKQYRTSPLIAQPGSVSPKGLGPWFGGGFGGAGRPSGGFGGGRSGGGGAGRGW